MHRLWSKVDSPSKTLQASKKALQSPKSGAGKKSVPNRLDSKAGDPVSLHGSLCDPKKHFEYLYFVQQSIIFALEKSTAVSLAFKVEMRMFLFQEKGRRTFLLYCDKRNQKHRKGKGDSPSLFHPFPFDNYG